MPKDDINKSLHTSAHTVQQSIVEPIHTYCTTDEEENMTQRKKKRWKGLFCQPLSNRVTLKVDYRALSSMGYHVR